MGSFSACHTGTLNAADHWNGMWTPRSIRLGLAVAIAAIPLLVGHHPYVLPAAAEGSSLDRGEGGYVPDFVAIVRQYNASGEPFRIEGVCKSACTLFLGIRKVCVDRGATLMFHAGHDIALAASRPAFARLTIRPRSSWASADRNARKPFPIVLVRSR